MTTVRIKNNTGGATLHVDRLGNITIQGQFTVQTSATESSDDIYEEGVAVLGGGTAPTNSMAAQAIAGGRPGDQPPIRKKPKDKSKGIIAAMMRRSFKERE